MLAVSEALVSQLWLKVDSQDQVQSESSVVSSALSKSRFKISPVSVETKIDVTFYLMIDEKDDPGRIRTCVHMRLEPAPYSCQSD